MLTAFTLCIPLEIGDNLCFDINGVFVYDTESGKAVKYHEIEHRVLQKVLDCFYEKNLHPFMFLYSDDYKLSIKYTQFDNDGMKEFYDEIRNEKPVNHPVNRGENHHRNRRQGEFKKFFVCKVI